MTGKDDKNKDDKAAGPADAAKPAAGPAENGAGEVGGPKGPEPTRYGDWEKNGIVSDF